MNTYAGILCLRLLEVRLGHCISHTILVLEWLVSLRYCRGIAFWCLGQGHAGGEGKGEDEEDHDGCGDEPAWIQLLTLLSPPCFIHQWSGVWRAPDRIIDIQVQGNFGTFSVFQHSYSSLASQHLQITEYVADIS